MKRIAAPMVGGLISSTILTLVIIPAVYSIWKRFDLDLKSKTHTPEPITQEVTYEGD